jgi:hypothetical protein
MPHPTITREQILAFRLQRHNLARRLVAGSLAADPLAAAAAVCGIQNSPPGSALLSLGARVAGVSGVDLDRALLEDRLLVQVWSVRAAPLILPATDAAVFTRGLLPEGEDELRFLMRGAGEHLQRAGLAATDLVDWTAAALEHVLDGCQLTKDELGVELSRRLAQKVPAAAAALWDSPDLWGRFGESLARFALNAVALRGAFCILSHPGRAATFVRTDQWLGQPFAQPVAGAGAEAAQLVRRYLAAYGPSTRAEFALWAGIAPGQAQRLWRLVEGELAAVPWGRRTLWLLAADAPQLAAAVHAGAAAADVRLLPPHDPYLAARDRALLLPDKTRHAQVWRAVGSPGVVLVNGEIAATWRAQKKGATLHVSVDEFEPLPADARSAVAAEADAVAPLRGCTGAAVAFAA